MGSDLDHPISMHKGDIINYGSRGSTKLGKFSSVFSLIPPDEGGAQMDDPPHLAGLKIVDPASTVPQKVHLYCLNTLDNKLIM